MGSMYVFVKLSSSDTAVMAVQDGLARYEREDSDPCGVPLSRDPWVARF